MLNHYFIVHAKTGAREIVGEDLFDSDGHCAYCPDRRWMVTDTYPKGPKNEQTLTLYNFAQERRIDIGKFPAIPTNDPSWRCDLHTRWDRQGHTLCFDSTHDGDRQMYKVDVAAITGS